MLSSLQFLTPQVSQIEPKLTLLNFVQSFHPRKLQRIEYVVSAGKLLIMSKQTAQRHFSKGGGT